MKFYFHFSLQVFEKSSFFKLSSCYVQFTSQDAADAAIEENGRMMHDSPIQVAPKTMSPENVKFRSFLVFHFFLFLVAKTTAKWRSNEANFAPHTPLSAFSRD